MNLESQVKESYSKITCNLNDRASCENWKSGHENIDTSKVPLYSYMMATYNDDRLLNAAVNSLLNQSYENWELVILDNSDTNPHLWEMIENAIFADKRIRGIKSDKNVGWPKAASICLSHIRGKYTSFLAADDTLCPDSLDKMSETLISEEPDILWVGNVHVSYNNGSVSLRKSNIPTAKIYNSEKRSEAIVDILGHVYYNSFFHYMKVDFLKSHNIDFFEPYYADCAGMTEAMVQAQKMIAIDYPVYCLTVNTSQTQGKYTWDSYQTIFSNQWKSIKYILEKEHYKDNKAIYYITYRIFVNFVGNIQFLCLGHCRDKYMNTIKKSSTEIITQLEDALCNEQITEMFVITGEAGFSKFINTLKNMIDSEIIFDEYDIENSILSPIIKLAIYSDSLTYGQQIDLLIQWLLSDANPACIGFYNFVSLLKNGGEMMIWKYRDEYKNIKEKYDIYEIQTNQGDC